MSAASAGPLWLQGDLTSPSEYVRDRAAQDKQGAIFVSAVAKGELSPAGSGKTESESSSIGLPGDSDDGDLSCVGGREDQNEAQSQFRGLSSLDSLEESLPIKRGLSNFYGGKSKSFGNLAEVSSVKELVKRENPMNKRRRTLIACKQSSSGRSSSSFYSWLNPNSMPLLALKEAEKEEEEEEKENKGEEEEEEEEKAEGKVHERKLRSFRSTSSLALSQFHHQLE